MIGHTKETKMLTPAENKLAPPASETKHQRAPTGGDGGTEELRVRVIDGLLDIRTFKRSPDSFSKNDWHPTAAGVSLALTYVGCLLDAIRTASTEATLDNGDELARARAAQLIEPEAA